MSHLTVVGAGLEARLPPLPDLEGAAVVVGGPVAERAGHAARAVEGGTPVLLLWPPAASALEAEDLAAHADEAGVEVAVARPLGTSAALSSPPWPARLVTLSVVGRPRGPLAGAGWRTALAGALDVCASLTSARGGRLEVAAERDGDALRAVVLAARFGNGAYAQAAVRFSDAAEDDEVRLYASRPGARLEARSLAAPFGRGDAPALAPDPEAAEVAAFVRALEAGERAPFSLDRALVAMRLTELVGERLR